MEKRVFENPKFKDKVTFIKTSNETNGAYSLVEVELLPGGGNSLHYHLAFTEEFIPVQGELGVDLEKKQLRLQPGKTATVPIGKIHRFYNPGNNTIRFQVKIVPGHIHFENSLKIAYGLAGDNKTRKSGIPKSFTHMALLVHLSDTWLPGFISFLQPVLRRRAKKALKNGVHKELLAKYC